MLRPKVFRRSGFTLVEMLIAISITLVMMATVVGIFATVSSSVQKRRAVIEASGQLRHVRNVLQRDLEGATCPAIPWQKPESNHGYFEIVEGLHSDFYPSDLTDARILGQDNPNAPAPAAAGPPENIDYRASTIPSSNLPLPAGWVTDGGGLGDYDDILAFTTRNEEQPFTGPAPADNVDVTNNNARLPFIQWTSQTISSPVAEVVWHCVENPATDTEGYLGTPAQAGFRTIYRRTLLVAPWLDFRYNVGDGPKSRPGVLWILRDGIEQDNVAQALAALVAFQERYDISARIEFDNTIDDGRWTIRANTLADLTKRENRYEHHGIVGDDPTTATRRFPFVLASAGGETTSRDVQFVPDFEYGAGAAAPAAAEAVLDPNPSISGTDAVAGYVVDPSQRGQFAIRPLALLDGGATARAVINELGQVVHVTTGLVPLGRTGPPDLPHMANRRGSDVMLSGALAFDVQVFDPEAPVYAMRPTGVPLRQGDSDGDNPNLDLTTVSPASPGWAVAATDGNNPVVVSRGAYVDLGYLAMHADVRRRLGTAFDTSVSSPFAGLPHPRWLLAPDGAQTDARLTRVYDTWSFHYEHDGIDQDGDGLVDEGTNGFDDPADYDDQDDVVRLGPDDVAERETSPPYPEPLRGVQVKLRVYESDSAQLREVTVRQHFVPE